MVGWRTNKRTRNVFPTREEDRWGNQIREETEPEVQEEDSGKGVNVVAECAGCGKPLYEGAQMYEIENEIVCSNCNRIDSRLMRAENMRQQAQQPAVSYSSVSGKHRGGSPSCSKCGHQYSEGESHQAHWDSAHPGE